MMGNPADQHQQHHHRQQQKATFSGMTALIGVVALVVDIIAVAVPHWGYYRPGSGSLYFSSRESLLWTPIIRSRCALITQMANMLRLMSSTGLRNQSLGYDRGDKKWDS